MREYVVIYKKFESWRWFLYGDYNQLLIAKVIKFFLNFKYDIVRIEKVNSNVFFYPKVL